MEDLSARYPVWFCDVWGVVHNGVHRFPRAVEALARHRARGGVVVLLTNAPRPSSLVEQSLAQLEVTDAAYDMVVTSGDVTRDLIARHAGGKIHYIGPMRDYALLDGLDVGLGDARSADAILCVGLRDDTRETAADYAGELRGLLARRLAMICANPDKIVRRGDRIVPCAGALAEVYAAGGGTVHMAGKPFRPIYDLAMRRVAERTGTVPHMEKVLAIGDGPETDVKGAADFGIDILLIQGGISEGTADIGSFETAVKADVPHARIVRTLPELSWP